MDWVQTKCKILSSFLNYFLISATQNIDLFPWSSFKTRILISFVKDVGWSLFFYQFARCHINLFARPNNRMNFLVCLSLWKWELLINKLLNYYLKQIVHVLKELSKRKNVMGIDWPSKQVIAIAFDLRAENMFVGLGGSTSTEGKLVHVAYV